MLHSIRGSYCCLAGLLALPVIGYAQQTTPAGADAAAVNFNKTNIVPGEFQSYNTFDHRYEGIQGTPYLQKGWAPAKVTLADKRQLAGTPARYDVFRRLLVIQPYANRQDSVWLDANRMHDFTLPALLPGQPERYFEAFADAPESDKRMSFVEVLYRGKNYALLKLPRKILVKANYQQGYAADRRFDELIDRAEYYLRRPDGTVAEVKLTRKGLVSAAPGLQTALNKSDIKTEQDAVRALQAAETGR